MARFYKSGIAAIGLAFLPGIAHATPPATLTQALVAAYYNNPTLQEQRAALRATDENVPAALAGWRPTVEVQGSYGRVTGDEKYYTSSFNPFTQKYENSSTKSPENGMQKTLQVTLTQPIYSGGKVVAQTRQANNAVYAARAQLLSTQQNVFEKVVQAYTAVEADQQVLALEKTNEYVTQKQLHATQTQFRLGEITMTSVAQAQASLAQAQAQLAVGQGNLQMARENFRQIVGEMPADQLAPAQPLVVSVQSGSAAGDEAIRNNPDVVSAKFNDAAAKDAVDVAFSALMPQVSFQASGYEETNSSGQDNFTRGGSFVGQLTVPLYQGGQEYASIRQARAKQQQAFAQVLDAEQTAYSQATQAWAARLSAQNSVVAINDQIKAEAIALDGTEREELVGTRTVLDVLNAQEALLSAQIQQVQNISEMVVYSYSLAAAMGQLTVQNLGLPVHAYNDQKYYEAVKYAGFGTGGSADRAAGIAPDGSLLNKPAQDALIPVASPRQKAP